jgi:hypothetical protein
MAFRDHELPTSKKEALAAANRKAANQRRSFGADQMKFRIQNQS